MTPEELKSKNPNDLRLQENELREELFKLKLKKGVGQLEKTHRLGEIRREVARVKTVLNQKIKEQENRRTGEQRK